MKCGINGCDNQAFKDNNECALHCTKNNYQVDRNSGLLSNFNRLLKEFVSKDIIDGASATEVPHIMLFLKFIDEKLSHEEMQEGSFSLYKDQKDEDMTDIDEIISNKIFNFSGFHFPIRDSRDSYDYLKWLRHVSSIYFINCFFYLRTLDFKDTKIFFDSCTFEEEFSFSPMFLLENVYNSMFSNCNFLKNFEIAPSLDELENNIYRHSILYNCKYSSDVTFKNSIFEEEIFYREKYDVESHLIDITNLEIIDCIFENKFKINNSKINNLKIYNSHFKSKFEIKDSEVENIKFEDSNIDKVFDAFGSKFEKTYFYKSIFSDFAGFEGVVFGLELKNTEEYQAKFIYTTFMSFSNFRSTKFLSGLDFSTVNLKQEPNFLNTYVHPKGTDRETFRIIKNSFEKSNNKIEAGFYHAREMNAYIKELSFRKNFWQLTVLHANNSISRFGQSYIIPFSLLLGCIALYSYLLNSYQEVLQFRNFEMQYGIEGVTEWLNTGARNFLPFARFISDKRGFEFVSLIFYIAFAVLTWQTIVAVKKQTQH